MVHEVIWWWRVENRVSKVQVLDSFDFFFGLDLTFDLDLDFRLTILPFGTVWTSGVQMKL